MGAAFAGVLLGVAFISCILLLFWFKSGGRLWLAMCLFLIVGSTLRLAYLLSPTSTRFVGLVLAFGLILVFLWLGKTPSTARPPDGGVHPPRVPSVAMRVTAWLGRLRAKGEKHKEADEKKKVATVGRGED